ncbi:Nif3-like dinuclear metal center hexameric protein [Verticiella sediminum]|uniref:Nif3-like dinuclear metal center hexameric protein n=1 Tax=Verticiella sediminum TaxID=1247510 RepID=A0A556A830_9BURK|nr:Nif3-like dinuclear metal center hexameric protein [Verticiella sediminum]TSH89054.1 Nif3-like dinuclear metal center hexameric protein [Verticiella sediminum]
MPSPRKPESAIDVGGVPRERILGWLADQLKVARFRDYAPNGLQVEGRAEIRRIVTGVTACEALLRAAIERDADAVLVHHGWFWRNEDPRIIGTRRRRIGLALAHDLNLLAYHLPLDAHPVWGNNAQLARVLGLLPDAAPDEGGPLTLGSEGLLWAGTAPGLPTLAALAARVRERLGREPLLVGEPDMPLGRVVWCTGAAQGMMQDAIDGGATVYITGEASEPTTHLARETGTGFIGAGHHATERYGVQALGQALAEHFPLEVTFVDIDNPV